MKYCDILDSIREIKEAPLTDKTASILADLLYIKKNWNCEKHIDPMPDMMELSHGEQPFSLSMAETWCAHMENEDGSTGPHWSMERIQQEITLRCIKCDPVEFWAVINAIYSDDVAVAKKHNVNTMDYYIDRAKAWLDDKDAVEDKAAAYYQYVVKH